MTKAILPIANGFYKSSSLPVSAQECVNWYPVVLDGVGLNQEVLFGTPGIVSKGTTGQVKNANRGSLVMAGVPYFVNGQNLYRLNEDFTYDELGSIEGTGRVSMDTNGAQLCVLVPGGKGYIFTASPDTLTEITDVDFRANGDPQSVRFIDSYFVFTTDAKKFIISDSNNGLAYNALDFGSAESNPDGITCPVVNRNQLFIAGTETQEAFQNIGGADFPWQRSGLFIQKGIETQFLVAELSDTFIFIGSGLNESPAIWAFDGSGVVKISTHPIESILQRLSTDEIADSFAWSYAQNGAYFVGFSIGETALVYDLTSKRWHERKSQIDDGVNPAYSTQWRVSSMCKAYGVLIGFDNHDGRYGVIDPDEYQEYGRNIIRRVATQPFQNNMDSFSVPSIELTIESGVGNSLVSDPLIRMDFSNDGKTFGPDRSRPMGKIGDYKRRAIWRRNGRMPRFCVVRFTMSEPVKPVIIQLTADIVSG